MDHTIQTFKQEGKIEQSCLGSKRGWVGGNEDLAALGVLRKVKDRCGGKEWVRC